MSVAVEVQCWGGPIKEVPVELGTGFRRAIENDSGQLKSTINLQIKNEMMKGREILYYLPAIRSMRGLKQLTFQNCQLDDEAAEYLAPVLADLPSLEMVDVQWNNIGPRGFSKINNVLKTSHVTGTQLQGSIIKISRNGIESIQNNMGVPALKELLSLPSPCSASRGQYCYEGQWYPSCYVFAVKGTCLSEQGFGDPGAKKLAKAMPRMLSVEVILFYYNNVTDIGAIAIARALPSVPNLKRLDMDYNYITQKGIETLNAANALRASVGLNPVQICLNGQRSQNDISDAEGFRIAVSLPGMPVSKVVDLRGRNPSPKVIAALEAANLVREKAGDPRIQILRDGPQGINLMQLLMGNRIGFSD